MVREIVFHGDHFIEFYQQQGQKLKEKIQYVLELIKQIDRVPEKFLKHLTGTNGLYEVRVSYQSNIYRIFCCFDESKKAWKRLIEAIQTVKRYEPNPGSGSSSKTRSKNHLIRN